MFSTHSGFLYALKAKVENDFVIPEKGCSKPKCVRYGMMRLAAGRTEGGRSVVMVIYRIRALTGVRGFLLPAAATPNRLLILLMGRYLSPTIRARVPTEI